MNDNFSAYEIPKTKYKRLLASYLQNEGTQLMNKVLFKYDLINNYKNKMVEFWQLFDIDYLENLYINWKRNEGASLNDSEWVFTGFVENICKSYQITREYYSYYATTTEDPDNPGNYYETTNILLNNLNMLRLLKMRRAALGFDGSREILVSLLSNSLNNKYTNDASSEINFVIRTKTENNNHASLQVYIVKPSTQDGDIVWTDYDFYLAKDGEYFVKLLGIEVDFEVIDTDTLVFDISEYDEPSKYK
jgi:hypothetical protein